MQLPYNKFYIHIVVLCLVLPNLSKAERVHSDTNFYQCLEQTTFLTEKLGGEHRDSELNRLKSELIQRFPKKKSEIINKIQSFIRINKKDPEMQNKNEEFAIYLNQIYGYPSSPSIKKSALFNLWLKFARADLRSSLGIGRSERCIQGDDAKFKAFMTPLKVEIKRVLSDHSSSREVLKLLDEVSFETAGSKTFFGATADYQNNKPRICVNPEEAIPLLVPKIIHELTHTKNLKMRQLNLIFSQAASEWQSIHIQQDQAEAELYDFEDNIKKQYLTKLETDNLIPKLKSKNLVGFKEIFEALSQMQNQNPYNMNEAATRKLHSRKIAKFIELDRKSDKLFKQMAKARSNYDIERFLDEHRAYLKEYFAAVYLSRKQPEVFCKIWVPSYAQKRPVRFFEAYLELESRLLHGNFSKWLGDLYTFKTKSYVISSLYKNERTKEIKKPILDSARAIISSQLKQEKLPRAKKVK